MFKQALLGLLLGISGAVYAQPYIGAVNGTSFQHGLGDAPRDYSTCTSTTSNQVSDDTTVFLGYRAGVVGFEVGTGKLFASDFSINCPWAIGSQSFEASHQYQRFNVYIPLQHKFDLVPFAGLAAVHHTNLEQFNASGEALYNYTTGRSVSYLYGVGLQKSFGHLFGRVEYQHMERVGEDYWTARGFHNSVDTVKFGMGFQF